MSQKKKIRWGLGFSNTFFCKGDCVFADAIKIKGEVKDVKLLRAFVEKVYFSSTKIIFGVVVHSENSYMNAVITFI